MDVDDDDVQEDDDEEDPEGEDADDTLEENKPVEEEILLDQQGITIIFVFIYIIKLFNHLFIFIYIFICYYSWPNLLNYLLQKYNFFSSKFYFFFRR